MVIRTAKTEDAESLLKIYSYYVENTALSFEYVTPSPEEFRKRISDRFLSDRKCLYTERATEDINVS